MIRNFLPIVLFIDSDLGIIAVIQVVYPETHYLLCIYQLFKNMKKKAKSKLHDKMIKSFVKDFYHMQNSYNKYQFEARYNQIFTKYELC